MRILVVDDEPGLLMTLAANLELEGFEVVAAESGARALDLFEQGAFDLVLSDIRMPGMNGVDLFRTLRSKQHGVPVVLMTAFALEGLVQEAIREGAFTVLPKPFDLDHVVGALTRAAKSPVVLLVDGDG
jgi:CheY-like chemotaxis protein